MTTEYTNEELRDQIVNFLFEKKKLEEELQLYKDAWDDMKHWINYGKGDTSIRVDYVYDRMVDWDGTIRGQLPTG